MNIIARSVVWRYQMKLTALFTDVYDGEEHERTEHLDVPRPEDEAFKDEMFLDEWAIEHLFPLTGDGNAVDKDAGYFVEITSCDEAPELVGREFSWGD